MNLGDAQNLGVQTTREEEMVVEIMQIANCECLIQTKESNQSVPLITADSDSPKPPFTTFLSLSPTTLTHNQEYQQKHV